MHTAKFLQQLATWLQDTDIRIIFQRQAPAIFNVTERDTKIYVEMPRIELGTFRMRSGRSTTELHPPMLYTYLTSVFNT